MDPQPEIKGSRDFATGEYRITTIEVVNGTGDVAVVYRFDQPRPKAPCVLNFGESFRLRVSYECLLPETPSESCGVAAAFTLAETMEHAMYFNTNYPHSDDELRKYNEADFRKYRGRTGVVEGFIQKLQVKAGDYLMTVGILANRREPHEFYEFHFMRYPISVQSSAPSFPAMFYPNVRFTHGPLELVTPAMIEAGRKALANHLPASLALDAEAFVKMYEAMMVAGKE